MLYSVFYWVGSIVWFYACFYIFCIPLFWSVFLFTFYPHFNRCNSPHLLTYTVLKKGEDTEHVQKWHRHEDCRASAEQTGGEARQISGKAFLSETQPVKRVISLMVGARAPLSHLCM